MKSGKWCMVVLATWSFATGFSVTMAFGETATVNRVTWIYTVEDGNATVTGSTPATGTLTIPSQLGGYPVTIVGCRAFPNTTITVLTVPDSVKNIEESAFEGCSKLQAVTIGNGVTNIAKRAFVDNVELASLVIGKNVVSIGCEAFDNCRKLRSLKLPDNVVCIGRHAFSRCSGLTSVTIPDNVRTIGEDAFSDCSGLTSVMIPDSVKSIGERAFYGCSNLKWMYAPESFRMKYVDGVFWTTFACVPSDCSMYYYAPAKTRTGVPYMWLEEHGLGDGTTEGYEAAAAADAANDAYTVADCYVAGLDPTDPAARFTANLSFTNGTTEVSWTPDLNEGGAKSARSYVVEGKSAMADAWDATNAASRFFRVKVTLP